MTPTTSEREAFEAWVRQRHGLSTEKWADSGKYKYDDTHRWWEAWQSALTRQEAPGAVALVNVSADSVDLCWISGEAKRAFNGRIGAHPLYTTPQPGGGWRPIAEAPFATDVLVMDAYGFMQVAMWTDNGTWMNRDSHNVRAVRWQPLPAALSGREAVATVCLRGDTYAHGLMTELQVQHAEGVEFPIGTKLYTTPQPGDGVVVPRWLLEQVYGMAREGCDAPTAAYRWCERIDGLFHGDESPEEYAEFAEALPVSFPAAPTAEGVAE